jgi:hypothetical protein
MDVTQLLFKNIQLSTRIDHNVVVYSDDDIGHTVILKKFPLERIINNREINQIDMQIPKKTITYV